jgi:hypothetical protein
VQHPLGTHQRDERLRAHSARLKSMLQQARPTEHAALADATAEVCAVGQTATAAAGDKTRLPPLPPLQMQVRVWAQAQAQVRALRARTAQLSPHPIPDDCLPTGPTAATSVSAPPPSRARSPAVFRLRSCGAGLGSRWAGCSPDATCMRGALGGIMRCRGWRRNRHRGRVRLMCARKMIDGALGSYVGALTVDVCDPVVE